MGHGGPRLTAALTGRASTKGIGPEEAHARNVLAIARRIHTRERRLAALRAEQKRLRGELREARRELKLVLQRDSTVLGEDDRRLEAAGRADAVDAVLARQDREGFTLVAPAVPARGGDDAAVSDSCGERLVVGQGSGEGGR